MSEVPLSLEELKIGIGKYQLLADLELVNANTDDMRRVVVNASNRHHIKAAENWRHANPTEARSIGAIANRALQEVPGGMDNVLVSIMSDHFGDLYGIQNILTNKAPYFQEVFTNLATQSPEDVEKCLVAIVAFSNGE